jgi:hypothetical protein
MYCYYATRKTDEQHASQTHRAARTATRAVSNSIIHALARPRTHRQCKRTPTHAHTQHTHAQHTDREIVGEI